MTMRGFSNWDGQLSISSSPSLPHSREGAFDNSRKPVSKSQPTPTHASHSSTTIISSQQSDEQESDCYIIDPKPQKIRGPRIHTRPSIEMKRMSSVDVLPAIYHPPVLDPQIQDMYEPSVTDNILTDHSHVAAQHNSHRVPTFLPSAGFSSLRNRDTPILPHPKPLPSPDTVIELDDDGEEAASKHDVIEISSDSDIAGHDNEDEEMVVDDMLTRRVSISPEPSLSSPSGMGGSLFTPPPSRKRRRRIILDHVAVPSFPIGLTTANYKPSSDAHSSAPQKGKEYLSVGDALAAAFAQNERSSSPLNRKGKGRERERECETTHTTPVPPKSKLKRVQRRFAEGVPTTGTAILNAYFPPIELEIPDFLPCLDDTWHRNTYWLERLRFKRHHAELHQNLPEMIAQMKSLGSQGNGQEDGPILPRVLAPLLERRPDIAASLGAQWEYASKHYRKSKSTKLLEAENMPSSSNSDPNSLPFANCDVDLNMEMDKYFNDLGDSLTKWQPSGTKEVRAPHLRSSSNAYSSASHPNGSLHYMTRLPLDVPFGERNDAVDGFLGVPPSPKHDHNLSSPIQYTDTYPVDHSQTLDDSFEHLLPEEGAWSGLPDVLEQEVVSTVSHSDSAGTIDPSLLSGSEPPPKPLSSPAIPTQIPKQLSSGPIIYVRRPPGVSALQEAPAQGTMLGKSRRNVQIKYRMSGSTSPMDEDDVVPNRNVTDVAGWTAEAIDSPPARSVARPSLKIRIRRSGTRASSDASFVPSQASTSASASPFIPSTPLPETRCPMVQEPTPAPTLQEGDKSEVESRSCHHCRRSTTKPKMQCSKRRQNRQICGKLFCDRCIIERYPELTFSRLSKTFVCPVCTNTCNCSQCARKRGEEYISMRGGGFAGSRTKSGIVVVPDADQAQDTQTMPEPPASAPQTMFWAHVYGLEGERVGRAFIGDATAPPMQPNRLSKSKSKPTQRKPKPKPEAKPKEKKPRVFIGMPLSEWKVRSFRDLEPSTSIPPLVAEEENYMGESKGKGKAVERPRVFIGDARWLHMPYTHMPASPGSSRASSPAPESGGEQELELDSDGSLTPLEDLEEAMDWPQPDVGEAVTVTWRESVCERSVSAPLSPDDVEKAIAFALAVTL